MPFRRLFREPPTAYRLVPFWFWNGEMEEEEIVQEIQEMAEKGIGGFFLCARQGLTVPYLSDEWFARVAIAIKAAQQYGLEAWLYDEFPYPSGMSGGEVTLQHPAARHRQLLHQATTIDGPQTFSYELPWARVLSAQAVPLEATGAPRWTEAQDISDAIGSVQVDSIFQATGLTAYTNKRFFSGNLQKRLLWKAPTGRWLISIFLDQEIEDFKYFGDYVDPCDREAVQTFLATTHEPYARYFGEQFGETIKGLFTDEVGLLGRVPWSAHLPTFFREHYGEDLIANLPLLLYPQGEKTARARYRFFQSIHRLLDESYHKPVSDWCVQHHLRYVTEVQSVRMTTQSHSHVPGGDSAHEKVGRSLEWILDHNAYSMRADPKIASSLARQLGAERSMIECFHSVGWSMTLQDAKWMLDRLAGLGINMFIFHAFFHSISGLRKHDAPPSQFQQNPYWPHFRQLADYAGRLSYALSQGSAEVPIAILHPATTFWTHMGNPFQHFRYCGNDEAEERELTRLKEDWAALCKDLLLHQIDFDHLDPEILARARIEEGQISIGQARYKILILPPLTNLETAAWTQIQKFLRAGGTVISTGLLPYEQIEEGQPTEHEVLKCFGLSASPSQRYWRERTEQPATRTEQPWTKGEHSAYFIDAPTGEQVRSLLEHCAPSSLTLEPVLGERTSFLTQQRNLSDGSRLLFIAHQEGTEKVLRLRLPQCPNGQRIERLDLLSGETSTLVVAEDRGTWTVQLTFAPYESYLLRYTYQQTGEVSTSEVIEEETLAPWTLALDVQQAWQLSARRNNILRLGTFRFHLDRDAIGLDQHWHEGQGTENWPLVDAKPFINQCADLATHQTLPVQFHQTFGTPLQSTLAYPVRCWYQNTFSIETLPPTCQILMDEDAISGNYTMYLNGHKISARDFQPTQQQGYPQLACEVQPFLIWGQNSLTLQVEIRHDEDGVRDPFYLSGPFGVFFATTGEATLGKAPETDIPHSGIQQGYPYYAGTLCFTRDIALRTLPREKTFVLDLQSWDSLIRECVEVLVNGHSLGVCCWSPYRWEGESEMLQSGNNIIEIRITNTLSGMLEGSFFDERAHQIVPIVK
jgi:hypothetical protein